MPFGWNVWGSNFGSYTYEQRDKTFLHYFVVAYIANNYISSKIKMVSVDGSRFFQRAADVMFDFVCGPCKADNIEREARHYRADFPEYLCCQCQDIHRKLPLTKNHRIVTGNQLPATDRELKVPGNANGHRSSEVILGRKIQSTRKVNVKEAGDSKSPFITGCAVMPNGYTVICDRYNYKIKLLDSSYTLRESLKLPSYPWDVSIVDDKYIIVTGPVDKTFNIFKFFHSWKLVKSCSWVRNVGVFQWYAVKSSRHVTITQGKESLESWISMVT